MAHYALIADGAIVNIVEWDGAAPFAPAGTMILPVGEVDEAMLAAWGQPEEAA